MSKRPIRATAVLSPVHRPAGWLRDRPIWAKLGIIMLMPTIATIVVGAIGVADHVNTSNNADRARTLSQLSADVGLLVHNLQDERAAATMLLTAPAASPNDPTVDAYRKLFAATDEAQKAYAMRRSGLADLPSSFRDLLRRLDNQLSALPALRDEVANRKEVSLTHTTFVYRELIAGLLAIRESAAQLAGETSLSDRMRAVAAISQMKEYLAQERVVVLRILGEGSMPPAREREFLETLAGQVQAQQAFDVVATPEEHNLFDQRVAGEDLRLAEKYEGEVESILSTGRLSDLDFGPSQWDKALAARANLLRGVEIELDRLMEAQATELRDAVVRQVLVETALLVGMLLLAVIIAWLVARSMARSLRELRQGALAVAQYGLPQAVARLRDPTLTTQLSPAQVAAQIAKPLPVRSRDEFGQVTEAFNTVHMEAVRTAAEQAALRASVATMFVNLARRSQILVDRLIGHLDRLERGEQDPDRLAELFQLDHLATRMRRNDENLLVLAGADSTRVQREPAALLDVLRAAQSEVEHYTRIEFGVVDRDIEVAAHAVNDLVHLVAELLDNATSFSPPDSSVIVEARRLGDRAILFIEDRGIGLTPEQLDELNERLTSPPMVDATMSRMMGLVVVARLAARHGVSVRLRPAKERGTVAEVALPANLLVPRALSGRLVQREGLAPRQPTALRAALGTPLALESGLAAGASRTAGPALPATDDSRGAGGSGDGERSRTAAEVAPSLFGVSRPLPAWSDLTGVAALAGLNGSSEARGSAPTSGVDSAVNGSQAPAVPALIGPGDPLPQRRPGQHRPMTTGGAPASTPQQASAASGPVSAVEPAPPVSAPPAAPTSSPPVASTSAPPVTPTSASVALTSASPVAPTSAPPAGQPSRGHSDAAGVPLAWPPVAPVPEETPPPTVPVPGELAAALDLTPEIPKPRPQAAAAVARPPSSSATISAAPSRVRESAWFQPRKRVTQPATSMAGPSGGEAVGSAAVPVSAPPVLSWGSAADEGWRAAADARDIHTVEATPSGLPKRVPMAQLVPGGVDKGASNVSRRTPEAVRGLLSAYHRGVQRGRSQPKEADQDVRLEPERQRQTPQPTTTKPQTSQAGKEQEV